MHIYVAHRSVMWVGLSGAAAVGITWAGVEAGVLHSLLAGPLCGLWGPLVVIVDIAGPSQLPSPAGSEAAEKQQGGQGERGQHPRTEAGQGLHLCAGLTG